MYQFDCFTKQINSVEIVIFDKCVSMQSLVECIQRTYQYHAQSERRFQSLRRESPKR